MLDDNCRKLIKDIVYKHLPSHSYQVFLFGSRATKTNRKWSDADVGILGQQKVPFEKLAEIQSELSDSNIPYRIDIVDFKSVTPEFAKIALSSIINL